MHENRETSEMPEANIRNRPAGEGKSRTARMHVFEESDSGTVPMNHSNKSGKPQAESEEGRPLIKENTHQLSTYSTQSEVRVSQGLAGVRKAARERKEMKFTALLHCNGSRSIAPIEADFGTLVAQKFSRCLPLLDHLKAVLAVKGSLRRSRWSRP